jgi:hypothetical protein
MFSQIASNENQDKIEVSSEESYCEDTASLFLEFKIVIKKLYGYGVMLIDPPLVVQGSLAKGAQEAYIWYDFGMEDTIPVTKERNFNAFKQTDALAIIVKTIKFDLEHAFHHYKGDPNYNKTHWALFGNLQHRVVAFDWYEDVKEYKDSLTAQMEFDFGS